MSKKWPFPPIKLISTDLKRGDNERFDAFVALYDNFANILNQADAGWREDFIARANSLDEDNNFGEALRDCDPEELERVCCNPDHKKLLVEFLLHEGIIHEQ